MKSVLTAWTMSHPQTATAKRLKSALVETGQRLLADEVFPSKVSLPAVSSLPSLETLDTLESCSISECSESSVTLSLNQGLEATFVLQETTAKEIDKEGGTLIVESADISLTILPDAVTESVECSISAKFSWIEICNNISETFPYQAFSIQYKTTLGTPVLPEKVLLQFLESFLDEDEQIKETRRVPLMV
eukprot:m.9228 g.9228  ORF g.9228 m.9228 type:complete len:190 (+) comp21194_c0_seq2:343-912(+)